MEIILKPSPQLKWAKKNKVYCKAYSESRSKYKRDNNLCQTCGQPNIDNDGKNNCKNCRRKRTLAAKKSRDCIRNILLFGYGNKCGCCQEVIKIFITVDHVGDDGAILRRLDKNHNMGTQFYQKIIQLNFPPEYRLLCFNCNSGRYLNGGICPHQEFNVFDRNTYGNTFGS